MEKKRQGRPKKIGAIYPGGQKGIQPDKSLDTSNPPKGGSGIISPKSETLLVKINGLYQCPKCRSTEIHQTYVNKDTEKLKYCNQCNYLGPTAPTYERAAELWNEAIEKG